ncbi:solute carrier family 2, facilitated glucose transporter member 9-like [Diretmus argenteus]
MSMPENNYHEDQNNNEEPGRTKESPGKQPRITVCLLSTAFFGAFGSSFLYGYNLSVVNAPAVALARVRGFSSSSFCTTSASARALVKISTLMASCSSSVRRGTLLVNNCFSLVGAVLLAAGERAGSFEMLIIGRFIVGIHAGISLNGLPMYLGEISPRHIRGSVTQCSSILANMGVLTGQILGLPEILGQESRWNFLFAFIALPALLQLSVLPFFPESPRYLLMEKKDKAGAEKALRRFLGKEDVTAELQEIQAENQTQNNLQVASVLGLLKNRAFRWQIITVIIIMACLQLSGVNAIALSAFVSTSLNPLHLQTTSVTLDIFILLFTSLDTALCAKLRALLLGLLIERAGRRPLIILGFGGMAVCYGLLTVFINIQDRVSWMPYLSFASILLTMAFFCLGPAGICAIVINELFEQSYRPAAFLIGGTVSWLCNFTVGLVFPFIQEALQTYVFLVFVVTCSVGAVYLFIVLPETKNKTFLDISQSFAKRNNISNMQPNNLELSHIEKPNMSMPENNYHEDENNNEEPGRTKESPGKDLNQQLSNHKPVTLGGFPKDDGLLSQEE